MTKPRYLKGCSAGSKVRGLASSPSEYAWNVNFNNGNSNWNHQPNEGFVRACRASECHRAVELRALYAAWREARRGKRPSANQLTFDSRWLDGLLELQERLTKGSWSPAPTTCTIAKRPKFREIHAPNFADRVMHHWLIPQLEAIYEPVFIFDSYANRTGKGTHAAVERLKAFVRQVESGEGGGWYLQLDVRNFFNSIHRPTLYRLLKERMARANLPEAVRRATHALLRHPPSHAGVVYACTPAERELVPAHKRLENAAPGCGIPIGNLSSQFFANVYLNELDQFVKHELRAPRYLRYVDDFVLVHHDRAQLIEWQGRIAAFLRDRLRLELKADARLKPLSAGIDFLGYIVYPTHTLVRPRVIDHAREALRAWERRHIQGGRLIATPESIRRARSIWSSYRGHLAHANTHRLEAAIAAEFDWLGALEELGPTAPHMEADVIRLQLSKYGAAP